jgi:putative oxygen-independent coproporphyrinogen III oxidase
MSSARRPHKHMHTIPLSLYVHLPWCVRKCPYCDFNSHTAGATPPKKRYLDALITDIASEAASHAKGRELVSIFLGGGTPSLFSPQEIARLLDAVAETFSWADDIEITMEANPGTVECGDPMGYREAGVNRLSIGAQSFSESSLKLLGRIHSVDDIARAVEEAGTAGFDSINLDLMYGLPGQDLASALADIESALALSPQHLSWYQLTLEPNTVFHARPPVGMPDSEQIFEIFEKGQQLLSDSGFDQYEVSAYAKSGQRSRHNLNYWSFGDYLAVGAGAHGKVSDLDGIRRYAKPANPLSYMQAIELGEVPAMPEPLSEPELIFEFMLNVLRLNEGFDEALFESRTGLSARQLEAAAETASERGLIERFDSSRWRPTALGRRFLNDLQGEFLPA